MSEIECLNDGERKVLLGHIRTRIKYIIQSVEILLDNGGDPQIAGALYIHAVEEYGKYLYVKGQLPVESGIVIIDMVKCFKNHNFKIKTAKDNLPEDCFILNQGGFTGDTTADWQTRLTILNTDLENGSSPYLPPVDPTALQNAVQKFKSLLSL